VAREPRGAAAVQTRGVLRGSPLRTVQPRSLRFSSLRGTLAAEIIPHMYALFPVPENMCRPALSHPDFHSNNILVSSDNPAHITGVVDWEFASILPLWAAYTFPSEIEDLGGRG